MEAKELLSGVCVNCGKSLKDHHPEQTNCFAGNLIDAFESGYNKEPHPKGYFVFEDSGLAHIQSNAVEVLLAAAELLKYCTDKKLLPPFAAKRLEAAINKSLGK